MSLSKLFIPTVIAFGLTLATPAVSKEPHSHGDAPATVQLRLDQGKKWQTDDALRRGISEIRTAMAQSLTPIHKHAFTPTQYNALAGLIQTQIDYVIGNCKLQEKADQQLHIVLEQMIDGVAAMKGGADRDKGAVKIVRALDQYGKYFDHPGFRPLKH